jgi:predicted transglutaminase-like cysteine proteinase
MRKSFGFVTAAAVVLGLMATGSTMAYERHFPGRDGHTMAPLGFQLFCLQHPAQCRAAGRSMVSMNPQLMRTLENVNYSVNHTIIAQDGVAQEAWTVNPTYGNCHDYAMTKRSRLIQMGLPASALRIAYGKVGDGEGHAILVVRTDGGDFVLDNRTGRITTTHSTDVNILTMSGANPTDWHNV